MKERRTERVNENKDKEVKMLTWNKKAPLAKTRLAKQEKKD